MTTPANVHLSVIIPAYNEEDRLPATLRDVVQYLSARTYRSEVVVVDDGSTDSTAEVVRQFPSGSVPVRLGAHPDGANHGKGAAVRLGMLAACGEFRLFMDADNSTTVDQVAQFWPSFEEGFDVVIGSRKAAGARVLVHQPWYKELAGRGGNLLIRLMVVPGILDTQAGFKMFSRACAEDLFPRLTIDRWGCDFELLAAARVRGYRIREHPITWINSPESKVRLGSYAEVLSEVWRVWRNLRTGCYDR